MASTTTARKHIEAFISREFRARKTQIKHYGPLSPLPTTLASSSSTTAPSGGASDTAAGTTVKQLLNPFTARYNPKTKRWAPAKYSLRQQAELVKKAKAAGLVHLLPPGAKTPVLDPRNVKVQKHNPHFAAVAAAAFEAQMAQENKWRQAVLPIQTEQGWTAGEAEAGKKSVLNESIYWDGKVDLKQKAGADLGVKLYAGKKRMFKGHRWERLKAARDKKREILMRDMAKRIRVYKDYYKKRRPNPLRPAKVSGKAGKLPF